MKRQVLYIHGGESFSNHADFLERLRTQALWHMEKSPDGQVSKKWTQTLAEDLGDDYEVIMPPMPNKQNAKFKEWKIWFERHFKYLHDGAVLIGSSLGAMFLAKYLSQHELPFRPAAVFLLAGLWRLSSDDDELYKDCEDFLVTPTAVGQVAEKYSITIMHSEDDFVVPFAHGTAAKAVAPQATFVQFTDKNHFLVEEFPELINSIKGI